MSDSLSAQANKDMIKQVKADKPSQFTVGAHADILARKGEATLSYDRTWKNGLGLTAYLRAWYYDQAVVPRERFGAEFGFETKKRF